jgi:hypothetical protein
MLPLILTLVETKANQIPEEYSFITSPQEKEYIIRVTVNAFSNYTEFKTDSLLVVNPIDFEVFVLKDDFSKKFMTFF